MELYSPGYYALAGGPNALLAQSIREQETGGVPVPELAVSDGGLARGPYQMHPAFMQQWLGLHDYLSVEVHSNPWIQAVALRLFLDRHFERQPSDIAGIYHYGAEGWGAAGWPREGYVQQVMDRLADMIP